MATHAVIMLRRLSMLGLELAVAERWAPAANRAHGSDHGLPSGSRAFSNGIEVQVRSADAAQSSTHNQQRDGEALTTTSIDRRHSCKLVLLVQQHAAKLDQSMPVQVLLTGGRDAMRVCMATSRMAASLNKEQVAAALAVADAVSASLARGMAAPLPTRALLSGGMACRYHRLAACMPCLLHSAPSHAARQPFAMTVVLVLAGPPGCRPWLAQLSVGVSALRLVHGGASVEQAAVGGDEAPAQSEGQPLVSCPSLLISCSVDAGAGPRYMPLPPASTHKFLPSSICPAVILRMLANMRSICCRRIETCRARCC